MGLVEQIAVGGLIKRDRVSFTTTGTTGEVDLGAAYALLSVEVDAACRLRLYDNASSRNDSTEASRPFTTTTIPNSISLIGDFNFTEPGVQTIDPLVFGIMESPSTTSNTFYRISSAGNVNVTVSRFLLYDKNVVTFPNSKRTISLSTNGSLGSNATTTGTITTDAPSTFLISKIESPNNCRVRMYRYASALSNSAEQNRPFTAEPSADVGLIIDAQVVGGSPLYLTPKILGANTQNLVGNSLISIRNNPALLDGVSAVYYSITNTGSPASFTAEVHILSLEE